MADPTTLDYQEERDKDLDEAGELLDLVAMEFKTDPTAVQCFDLRIVRRVIAAAEKWRVKKYG